MFITNSFKKISISIDLKKATTDINTFIELIEQGNYKKNDDHA